MKGFPPHHCPAFKRRRGQSKGFTLIEVVLALTILVMVFGIAYTSLEQIIRTKRILDDERDITTMANSLLMRLSREIQLANGGTPGGSRLMKPSNDATSCALPMQFLGETTSGGRDSAADRVTFIASEGGQYLPDGSSHAGLVQITYRAEPDPDASSNKDATMYLVRDEIPMIRPCTRAFEKAMIFPITKSLVSFDLSYFDGDNQVWVKEWGAESPQYSKLPSMVRATMKLRSPQGREMVYSTVVALPR